MVKPASSPPFAVLHIPHSATTIPADLRGNILLSDEELGKELLAMTDRYTEELFALPSEEAASVIFTVSRLVLDPERFVDDALELMASRGMGVLYTLGSQGQPIRNAPLPAQKSALLSRFYSPHHLALFNAAECALRHWGHCLLIDCHSFPSRPLPYELDQSWDRPQICLGTDGFHTPTWLTKLATELFSDAGFQVATNRPFSGALVPGQHFQKDSRLLAIMIEVNRAIYMNESTGERLPAFGSVATAIQRVTRSLIDSAPRRVATQQGAQRDRR
jgi:N-formylglutamate deformylase